MKHKIKIYALLAIFSLSLFSCGSKQREKTDVKINETPIHRLNTDGVTRVTFDGISEALESDINNGTGKVDSTGKILSYGNTGSEIQICELVLLNHDDTKYYFEQDDDILYNGVLYVGLNKALNDIKSPYDKRDFINFVLKALNPTHYAMLTVVYNDHDPNTTAMPLDDVLEEESDVYSTIKSKYGGSKVWWQLDVYDPVTNNKSASLYGCEQYVVYRGNRGELKVDLAKLQYKQPEISDTPEYIQNILDGYKDYDGSTIMSSAAAGLSEEEYHKFFDIDISEEDWIKNGVLG